VAAPQAGVHGRERHAEAADRQRQAQSILVRVPLGSALDHPGEHDPLGAGVDEIAGDRSQVAQGEGAVEAVARR
jgi:hypothetical protein